jgi:hypothetical protein
MIIADHIEPGLPLPRPGTHRSRKFRPINLPALQTAETELYDAFVTSGIRKAELARRLGMARANIDRLFDHQSRLDQIEAAFAATSGSRNGRSWPRRNWCGGDSSIHACSRQLAGSG